MSTRLTLPVVFLALSAAACGAPERGQDTDSTAAVESDAAVEDVVRTADPAARGYTAADFPRVQEIAPGVFTYEQLYPRGDERVTAVSMFVVTDEGVLVADGQGSVEETQLLLDHIAEVTDEPVTTVVVGSDHGDHTGGNAAFPSGATFLVHPTSLSALEARDAAPSTVETVSDSRLLTMGGREIHVIHMGRAHTGGDLMVHLPAERVLFMGEVFFNHVFPTMRTAFPREWVATIQAAQGTGVDIYVPGHGFVDSPAVLAQEVEAFKGAIQLVIDQTEAVHDEGAGVEEALGRAEFGDVETWSLASTNRETAIRRVYADLNSELPR